MKLRLAVGVVMLASALACSSAPSPAPEAGPVAAATPAVAEAPVQFRQATWSDAVLYFVILDRWADGDLATNREVDPSQPGYFHGGDLTGLIDHLDEIADLGVTALWVTPLVKNIDGFVTGAGFPDWGYHGYWADDFTRLDDRFGTEDELAALVRACHARGIKVLLDVVYNHVGYDSHYVEDPSFQPWLRVGGECGDDDLTMCVAGLPDLRTELPEVADYLMKAHLGRARRVGLDGFRLDTVKHVSHEFWQEHRSRTRAELGDDFFLLGEVWGGDPDVLDAYFADDEMDAGFDFTFQGSTIAWLEGRGRTVAFNRYLERRHRTRAGYHLAQFLSSHDVPTAPYLLKDDWQRYRLAVALQMTTVGIPVMYYGEEVGRRGGDWPDNRSDMPWGERGIRPGRGIPRDETLRADVARLVGVRRSHPALSRGGYQGLSSDGDLLVFLRDDPPSGDAVLVALNRGGAPASASFELPAALAGRELVDPLGGPPPLAADGRLELQVEPLSVRIIAIGASHNGGE